jgi:hypothetical protein
LRLTQGGISRCINGEFTADGSCGECSGHKENLPQPERMYKRRLARMCDSDARRSSLPPLPFKRRGFQLVRF